MDENFEFRDLLSAAELQSLQHRNGRRSLLRFTSQLALFVGACVLLFQPLPIGAKIMATLVLAGLWASFFAPFHEATHTTAFRSRLHNRLMGLVAGLIYGFPGTVFKFYHFAHHRHTRDLRKDPELSGSPQHALWPKQLKGWILLLSGHWLLRLKLRLMLTTACIPVSRWSATMPWLPVDQYTRAKWEGRVFVLVWGLLMIAAVAGPSGFRWMLAAWLISHVYLAVWLTAEHTGLPVRGTILSRTRTMHAPALVRWCLWNMNYHAEHHAWPGVPWHALPELHRRVVAHLDHQSTGYLYLQRDLLSRVAQARR